MELHAGIHAGNSRQVPGHQPKWPTASPDEDLNPQSRPERKAAQSGSGDGRMEDVLGELRAAEGGNAVDLIDGKDFSVLQVQVRKSTEWKVELMVIHF